MLDLLVHIHRAVPEGEGVYRDEQARREAAVTADPAKAEPAPGDREGASTVAEPGQEPRYREDDQDQVLNGGHPDLGASGYPDADDRDSEHDQAQRRVDADTGPGVSRAGSEYGQHGRAEDDNLGHGADHVTRDHQPPGQEPQVRVDRAAYPLERGTAVRAPQVQPAVAIGDDEHGQRGQDEDRPGAVSRRQGQRGHGRGHRPGRSGRGHANHRVLDHADRIRLQPGLDGRSRDGTRRNGRRPVRQPGLLSDVGAAARADSGQRKTADVVLWLRQGAGNELRARGHLPGRAAVACP